MPFKNTAKFIEATLQSILQQSYTNWELLAVNDSSTDESARIVASCAQKYPQIQLLQNKGKGILPALRTAYQKASGDFITRMDSDDLMLPQQLEVLWSNLQGHPKGFVSTGGVEYFKTGGIGDGFKRYEAWLNTLTARGDNFKAIYKECPIPSPCWMLRKSDLDSIAAFEADVYPEDYDLVFRMYAKGFKVVPCKQVLLQWRDYPERSSRNDPHYADFTFTNIKMHYFLKLDWHQEKALLLWGAGKKGKKIAAYLTTKDIDFTWISRDSNKVGNHIQGKKIQGMDALMHPQNTQSIVSDALWNESGIYKEFLQKLNIQDVYFFS